MPRVLCRCWLLVTCCLAAALPLYGGTDYLVVERVDRLTIYNKYQQETAAQDRSFLVPFVPMRIVRENDLLSDGYTRCMQVEIGGSVFFLLKDQESRLAHSGDPGYQQTFSNVTPVQDTLQILKDRTFSFSPIRSARHQPLRSGERVVRVFLRRNEAYCQLLDGSQTFGWIDFGEVREGRDWKVFSSLAPASTVIPDNVMMKIRTRVNEVNTVLQKLFLHFNTETHQQKPAPRWNVALTGDSLLCVLEGAPAAADFQQSTLYLAKDIENFTLGAGLLVAHSPGRLEVTTRGEH